jgi:hypothetical protein
MSSGTSPEFGDLALRCMIGLGGMPFHRILTNNETMGSQDEMRVEVPALDGYCVEWKKSGPRSNCDIGDGMTENKAL